MRCVRRRPKCGCICGGEHLTPEHCGACEPECQVEAIFPEDALPDKWETFVPLNYAFPDAEKINALVDEYAAEHNVRNAPLEKKGVWGSGQTGCSSAASVEWTLPHPARGEVRGGATAS